jgi:hypothetical protein
LHSPKLTLKGFINKVSKAVFGDSLSIVAVAGVNIPTNSKPNRKKFLHLCQGPFFNENWSRYQESIKRRFFEKMCGFDECFQARSVSFAALRISGFDKSSLCKARHTHHSLLP